MNVVIMQNVSLCTHLALSTYLRSIAKYLAAREEVNLYLVVQGPVATLPEVPPRNICFIDADTYSIKSNFRFSWLSYKALKELNRESSIDLIHCLYPNSSLMGAAMFKHLYSPDVKIIYDVRSPWIEASIGRLSLGLESILYRKIAYAGEGFLGRFVDGYIFITRGLKDIYEEMLKGDLEPSILIPSGVDLDIFARMDSSSVRDSYRIDDDDILIGYVGVLSRERELDFSIRALHELSDEDDRYKLMFVGRGDDQDRLRHISRELGIQEKIIFTGSVDYEMVPQFISAFDFGLCHLPDKLFFRHSFPMKVLEYIACGTPVLASNIAAHRDIAEDIPMSLYGNGSPSELARKVMELNGDNAEAEDNIHMFAWPNIASDLVEYYRDMTGSQA
ncbi:MAG: glycosyltransferase family 4 protein [Actinomycetota bacterium]|nr:glycosyltransferase family 4 protein [Actinomycetota bacterium]